MRQKVYVWNVQINRLGCVSLHLMALLCLWNIICFLWTGHVMGNLDITASMSISTRLRFSLPIWYPYRGCCGTYFHLKATYDLLLLLMQQHSETRNNRRFPRFHEWAPYPSIAASSRRCCGSQKTRGRRRSRTRETSPHSPLLLLTCVGRPKFVPSVRPSFSFGKKFFVTCCLTFVLPRWCRR